MIDLLRFVVAVQRKCQLLQARGTPRETIEAVAADFIVATVIDCSREAFGVNYFSLKRQVDIVPVEARKRLAAYAQNPIFLDVLLEMRRAKEEAEIPSIHDHAGGDEAQLRADGVESASLADGIGA